MKKLQRNLLAAGLLVLAVFGGTALYLVIPPLSVSIRDSFPEARVAFVGDNQNNGTRCSSKTVYCFDSSFCDEGFTIDPHCAQLQKELLDAAEANDSASARLVIGKGANVNSPGISQGHDWWIIPMHPAASSGNTEIVRLLLDNGADVNDVYACCFLVKTPLMEAVAGNHLETARLLIARGANVKFKGIEDWTALKEAEQDDNEAMIGLLDRAGAMSWQHRAERRLLKLLGKSLKEHHYRYPE